VEGQKTGWFYDHRDNRKYLSMLAGSRKVLDLYAHSGGFGLLCAAHDAAEVVMVDRSQLALNLAEKAAYANNLTRYAIIRADIFQYLDDKNNEMPKLSRDMGFDMVNADPPAFIKTRDDIAAGLKGYEKLVKKCLPLVNEGGIFAISSCSSFARPEQFQKVIDRTLAASGREFSLLRRSGADKDHPIHPMLGETNYLKFLAYQLD
jgi:23S rRNA (cytosine1962-C5)-methyltransferase